jgi:hypothetical protein
MFLWRLCTRIGLVLVLGRPSVDDSVVLGFRIQTYF